MVIGFLEVFPTLNGFFAALWRLKLISKSESHQILNIPFISTRVADGVETLLNWVYKIGNDLGQACHMQADTLSWTPLQLSDTEKS